MQGSKKIAIIGSHGLYANYGGWDQLVRQLAERKSPDIEYLIFNSADTQKGMQCPPGVKVKHLIFNASGFQGLFYDFLSIIRCFWSMDTLLLLGIQGIPLIAVLSLFKNVRIVTNVGGIEWERPKFGYFSKKYLQYCFKLSFLYSNAVILDNPHYKKYIPNHYTAEIFVIPYGGEIDNSLMVNDDILKRYHFIKSEYYLSISRSLEDNLLDELCQSFRESKLTLVLISNLSKSSYGNAIYRKYNKCSNIILINGLYHKPELDLVRRNCKAYIHTHTLCGTAPSLVEMIVAQKPIISIDNPQNRFTLQNEGWFFSSFAEMQKLLKSDINLNKYIPSQEICKLYHWNKIVSDYESIL